ncbi:MAG: hypothetical protein Q4A12_00735 [Eubacteriales bacterium]|nr:hypothetical protein [Eubacteriales bacterium]
MSPFVAGSVTSAINRVSVLYVGLVAIGASVGVTGIRLSSLLNTNIRLAAHTITKHATEAMILLCRMKNMGVTAF